jgi:hypothetical protein
VELRRISADYRTLRPFPTPTKLLWKTCEFRPTLHANCAGYAASLCLAHVARERTYNFVPIPKYRAEGISVHILLRYVGTQRSLCAYGQPQIRLGSAYANTHCGEKRMIQSHEAMLADQLPEIGDGEARSLDGTHPRLARPLFQFG